LALAFGAAATEPRGFGRAFGFAVGSAMSRRLGALGGAAMGALAAAGGPKRLGTGALLFVGGIGVMGALVVGGVALLAALRCPGGPAEPEAPVSGVGDGGSGEDHGR